MQLVDRTGQTEVIQGNNVRIFAGLVGLWLAVSVPDPALAYIGPGAGLTAIGSILAFFGVIILLVAGFVWYPVKRLIRGRRSRGVSLEAERAPDSPEP